MQILGCESLRKIQKSYILYKKDISGLRRRCLNEHQMDSKQILNEFH